MPLLGGFASARLAADWPFARSTRIVVVGAVEEEAATSKGARFVASNINVKTEGAISNSGAFVASNNIDLKAGTTFTNPNPPPAEAAASKPAKPSTPPDRLTTTADPATTVIILRRRGERNAL